MMQTEINEHLFHLSSNISCTIADFKNTHFLLHDSGMYSQHFDVQDEFFSQVCIQITIQDNYILIHKDATRKIHNSYNLCDRKDSHTRDSFLVL